MTGQRERSWTSIVITGLAALGIAAVVIGGVAGIMAYGATKATGLGDDHGASAPESLYMPPYTQTPIEPPTQHLPTVKPSTSTPTASATPTAPSTPAEGAGEITLEASPTQVSPGARITLSGVYAEGSGDLQVQRLEDGAWIDFPVTSTVKADGSFSTTVSTGRAGQHTFRVFDASSGRSSNSVVVTIG